MPDDANRNLEAQNAKAIASLTEKVSEVSADVRALVTVSTQTNEIAKQAASQAQLALTKANATEAVSGKVPASVIVAIAGSLISMGSLGLAALGVLGWVGMLALAPVRSATETALADATRLKGAVSEIDKKLTASYTELDSVAQENAHELDLLWAWRFEVAPEWAEWQGYMNRFREETDVERALLQTQMRQMQNNRFSDQDDTQNARLKALEERLPGRGVGGE